MLLLSASQSSSPLTASLSWAPGRKVRRCPVPGPPAGESSGASMKKAPRLLLAGVAVLVGVASASVGRAENLSSAGTVTAVAGPVTVSRLSATPQPLKFRDTLYWRDVVEARKDGIARVLLGGKKTGTGRDSPPPRAPRRGDDRGDPLHRPARVGESAGLGGADADAPRRAGRDPDEERGGLGPWDRFHRGDPGGALPGGSLRPSGGPTG